MPGEKNLQALIANLSPHLDSTDYVFCSIPQAGYGDCAWLEPLATMQEAEGLTLVVPRSRADSHGVEYEGVYRRITLQVHSALDAVGLTALFSGLLGERGISANVVAGYYHDHIFVPAGRAEEAYNALVRLSQRPG